MARNRKLKRESIRFDAAALGRRVALKGLLRGELRREAGLSPGPIADAFAGRPVGVRAARSIARVLGCEIAELADTDAATTCAG